MFKRLSRRTTLAGTAFALAMVGVVGFALPAQAGSLQAYRDANYGAIVVDNGSLANYIDVTDDIVSSVHNYTSVAYNGMDSVPFGETVLITFAKNTSVAGLSGSQQDNIDHFRR